MMNLLRRMWIPGYARHTIGIKWKSIMLKARNGNRPFDTYKETRCTERDEQLPISNAGHLLYIDKYYSFSYFDSQTARRYYADHPSTIHRVMLALIDYNTHVDSQQADAVYNEIMTEADQIIAEGSWKEAGLYYYTEASYTKFDLTEKRYSGILQAKIASLLIRCHQLSKDDTYKRAARAALIACLRPIDDQGVARELPHGHLWVEEYTSPTPSMVLNGFVFVVIAMAEYAALYDDPVIRNAYTRCHTSLISWLPHYRVGDDILYSMYHWDLANMHYLGIQTYQMEHLAQITQDATIDHCARYLRGRTDWEIFSRLTQK